MGASQNLTLDLPPDQFGTLPLADLFEAVDTGSLALPELQRPAVWQDSKVPELLDSLYRGYPLGVMLVWTPLAGDQLRSRRWKFADGSENNGRVSYFLIDGQQRLTSLYRSLHGRERAEKERTLPVVFNLIDEEFSLVDGQMQSKLKNPAAYGCYPVRTLLEIVRQQAAGLREIVDCHPSAKRIFAPDGPFSRLLPTNVKIAAHSIGERSYAEAVEIFARVNRGTPVKRSQIILARLSVICPGIVGDVEEYLAEREEVHGGEFDLDFVIGGLAVVARGSLNIEPLDGHFETAEEVQAGFRSTSSAIDKAFAFLDRHLGMDSLKHVPNSDSFLLLAKSINSGVVSAGNEIVDRQAADWIVKSLLTGYHDNEARVKDDLRLLNAAEETESFPFAGLKSNHRAFAISREMNSAYKRIGDVEERIPRNDYLLDFLYAILRVSNAPSFNRQPMWPAGFRPGLQVHHLYARSNLQRELHFSVDETGWLDERRFDDIGNLTFILTQDNSDIGNESIEYLGRIDSAIRKAHFIGDTAYQPGRFKDFVTDRRSLLRAAIEKYIADRTVEA